MTNAVDSTAINSGGAEDASSRYGASCFAGCISLSTLGSIKGGSSPMAKVLRPRFSSRDGVAATFVDISGAPGAGVARGTRMPEGSIHVTIAPEVSKKASARAEARIKQARANFRRKLLAERTG